MLLSSITNNEILECDFKYYRIDKNGGLLHYKTIKLTKSSIIRIKNTHPNSLLKNEYYLSYQLWDGDDIVIIEFVIPREQAKCLFYFVFPYFLSLFAWYTHIYFDLPKNSNLGSGTLLGEFGYITVTIYIIYGSFLIPLIAFYHERSQK